MVGQRVVRCYARALFESSQTQADAENTLHLLEVLADKEIIQFMNSKAISKEVKQDVFKRSLSNSYTSLLPFLHLLIDRGHFSLLPGVVQSLRSQIDHAAGVERGTLAFSSLIDPAITATLREKWQTLFGKKLIVEEKIDPSLLSGAQLNVGDKRLDCSAKNILEQLKGKLCR